MCFCLLCACSAPTPADAIEFIPAATAQVQPVNKEPAIAAVQATEPIQSPAENSELTPGSSSSPAQTHGPEDAIVPKPAPEEAPTPRPAATSPISTPKQDTAAATVKEEILTLQSVAEISSVMRIQIPRALVEEGVSPTAEYVVNITYSSKELLSCVVEVIGADVGTGNTLVPVTLDLKTGQRCKLSDFFSKVDTGWKGLLPDLVTDQANKKDLTLLCEVPPVGEDQPFYIESGNIVLLYRPYEIATYEAGAPAFVLPKEELTPYLSGAYGIGE